MVVFIRVPSWLGRRGAHPENVMAQLDIGYAMAALARQGVDARMLDLEAEPRSHAEILQLLSRWQPGTVVLHAITPAVPHALEIARQARERIGSIERVVAVGQHASVLPGTLLEPGSPVDLCIRGEYEEKIVEVVCDADVSPEGLARRDEEGVVIDPTVLEVHDLDALPMPTHELFMGPRYKVFHPTGVARRWRWGFLLSSRGCPYSCVYCSPTLRNSFGREVRLRSTAGVVEELEVLRDLGATVIHFRDDVFTYDRGRVLELCDALERRRFAVPWTAQTRPDRVDRNLLASMKRAGCASIYFGVESGSPRILERLRKGSTVEQVVAAFAAARDVGLYTVGFFMIGNPDETEDDIRQTHELLMKVRPDIIQVAYFTPYPGSAVFDAALLEDHPAEHFSHYNFPINPSAVPDDRLRQWQRRFYLDFIFRSGFIRRYVRHQALPNLINAEKFADFARLGVRALARRGDA